MRHPLSLAVALSLSTLAFAQPVFAAPSARTTTQLPRTVNPVHYAIQVTPDAANRSFKGNVVIDVEVLTPTKEIVLNAANLKVGDATWYLVNPLARVAPVKPKIAVDEKAQTVTLTLANDAVPGKYQLALDYSGVINTQANGLFSLDYDSPEGKKRGLYTQFENSDARRFVPSWDEPSYKATFDLTATVPATQMAVSNMPVRESQDLPNGMRAVTFATTPKMSTYLLFFSLGEFERATTMADGVEIGVVTQKGKLDQAKLALDGSAQVLKAYNEYFGTPFPMPKLDNVAAPGRSQFFSAMENWGAIFTFEHTLLLDPTIGTVSDKQRVYGVAAHEIAHQWFGNLVTMDWWDDLWLNEGFATWMAGRMTEQAYPEWETNLNRVGRREGAMAQDAVATTHPVVQKILDVDQASQAFDGITYSKGGSVIAMLEEYVGADNWRNGVRAYMKKHAYGNTQSDDLWAAVQTAAGKPVLDIAHDFTLKPGIPLMTVRSAQCVQGKTVLDLEQGEYSVDQPGKKPLLWRVPVSARILGADQATQWTVSEDHKAQLKLDGCGTVVLDPKQTGYYRIAYTDAQLKDLAANFAKLDTIDQLGVMGNQRALGLANLKPLGQYLDFLERIPGNANPNVLEALVGGTGEMYGYFDGDKPAQARVAKFGTKLLRPVFANVGWDAKPGESDSTSMLRSELVRQLASLGDPAVIAEAKRRFAADVDGSAALTGDMKEMVWAVVARSADEATWNQLRAMAAKETTPLIKKQLFELLASAKDEKLAAKALAMTLTDEVGATDGAAMIAGVARRHPELAFDFASTNAAAVNRLVDTTSRYRFYPGLLYGSGKADYAAKLRTFADANIPKNAQRATESVIAAITLRNARNSGLRKQTLDWLKAKGY